MPKPRRRSSHAPNPLRRAAKLWQQWLYSGRRPLPLDAFVARQHKALGRQAAVLTHLLRQTAAYAAPAAALQHKRGPAGLPDSLDGLVALLRQLDAFSTVALAAELAEPDALQAPTRRLLEAWPDDLSHRALRAGVPPAWFGPLHAMARVHGLPTVHAWLQQLGERPPLWLRVDHPQAVASLRDEGYTVLAEDEGAVAVRGTLPIHQSTAYQQGWVEVQDLASQQIGRAVQAEPEQLLWDLAAGRGGKSTLLARQLQGRGVVHATDIRAGALDALRTRADRLGLADAIQVHAWDGEQAPSFGGAVRRRGGFDAVLVDAPCSASGTWRRDPDARLRAKQTDGFAPLQRRLLALAAEHVRPGGRLVYGTCSVWPAENESVVDHFRSTHPDWTLLQSEALGGPHADADRMFVATWRRPEG